MTRIKVYRKEETNNLIMEGVVEKDIARDYSEEWQTCAHTA